MMKIRRGPQGPLFLHLFLKDQVRIRGKRKKEMGVLSFAFLSFAFLQVLNYGADIGSLVSLLESGAFELP
jgi:hypothetical protein